jgi:hypothetical protein
MVRAPKANRAYTIEPIDELFRVLAEVVVGVEALILLFDPVQFFRSRSQRIEDLLAIHLSSQGVPERQFRPF